jgi:FAD/FMN-containing dehydrogenase
LSVKAATRANSSIECGDFWTRGTQYPAEHNVGQLYEAKPALIDHYKSLDPRNCFNPGIGRTSKYFRWRLLASAVSNQ